MAFYSNEVIAVSTTVETLTLPTGYPTSAMIGVEDAPVRLTLDGTDPDNTAKNGIVIPAGTVFNVLGRRDLENLKMIKSDSTDSSVSVNYEQAN